MALVLALMCRRSMSPRELTIQREGYAAALNHPDVVRASRVKELMAASPHHVRNGPVTGSVREVFDWTLIETEADARSKV